ncbi:MAG TPA: hypothetical protein VF221_07435 [Chloroflexota bacterium]
MAVEAGGESFEEARDAGQHHEIAATMVKPGTMPRGLARPAVSSYPDACLGTYCRALSAWPAVVPVLAAAPECS